jgi:hypothetical protein
MSTGFDPDAIKQNLVRDELVRKIFHCCFVRTIIVGTARRQDNKNLAVGTAIADYVIVQLVTGLADLRADFYLRLGRTASRL